MSFFADDPEQFPTVEDEPTVSPPWEAAPKGEIPVMLPLSGLISSNEQAALVVSAVRVYGSGVEFSIQIKVRRGDLADDDWDDLLDRTHGLGHRRRRSGSGLRVGVQLTDGTRLESGELWSAAEDDGPRARLSQNGGSGSGSDSFWISEWHYWLWPLPPDGPLTLVTEWSRLGLAEASYVVDGHDLAAIARDAQEIWPGSDSGSDATQSSWSTGR